MQKPGSFKKPFGLGMFLLVCLYVSYGQSHITGMVKDSAGGPVIAASVSMVRLKDQSGLDFTRTDEKGRFSFVLPDTMDIKGLAIKVNAIGFFRAIKNIITKNTAVDFVLAADIKELPGVSVKNSFIPIRIKRDTLSYSAKDFSDRNDRTIGDVIRKIPGIEVDDNGTIKYQGKPINYFYIDGDNILDNRYTIATKNIPPDIVEKIQVIENNQHIKLLNGIIPSNRAAINITLKENAKLNFINHAKAGANFGDLLEGEVNSMAFRSRFKAINLAKYNNTGDDVQKELASSNISKQTSLENSGAEQMLDLNSNVLPPVQKKRFLFNHAAAVSVNDFVKTGKDLSLRVNGFYLSDRQEEFYRYYNNFYLPNDTITYREEQNIHRSPRSFHATLAVNVNTTKNYLDNILSLDYNTMGDFSAVVANSNPLNQYLNGKLGRITNSFNTIKLFGNNRFIEFSSFIDHDNREEELAVEPGLYPDLVNHGVNFERAIQQVNSAVFSTENFVGYKMNAGHFFQNYKAGMAYQSVELLSKLMAQQSDHTVRLLPDTFRNDLAYRKYKIYAEAEYRWDVGRSSFNLTLPAGYSDLRYTDATLQKRSATHPFLVTPSLRWQYRVGNENLFTSAYHYDVSLSNYNEIYQGVIMTSYQSFEANQVPVQQNRVHTYSAGFDFKRSIQLFFVNAFYSYTQRLSDYLYATRLENNIIQRTVILQPNTGSGSALSLGMSKFIFSIKTNLYARYVNQVGKFQQLQNALLFPVTSYLQTLTLGATAKPAAYMSLNYEFFVKWLNSTSGSNINSVRHSISSDRHLLDLNVFLSGRLSLKSRNEYYFNRDVNANTSAFFFSDISARYNLATTSDIELTCTNLSNTDTFITLAASENNISSGAFKLRPRSLLVRVSFRF